MKISSLFEGLDDISSISTTDKMSVSHEEPMPDLSVHLMSCILWHNADATIGAVDSLLIHRSNSNRSFGLLLLQGILVFRSMFSVIIYVLNLKWCFWAHLFCK